MIGYWAEWVDSTLGILCLLFNVLTPWEFSHLTKPITPGYEFAHSVNTGIPVHADEAKVVCS